MLQALGVVLLVISFIMLYAWVFILKLRSALRILPKHPTYSPAIADDIKADLDRGKDLQYDAAMRAASEKTKSFFLSPLVAIPIIGLFASVIIKII